MDWSVELLFAAGSFVVFRLFKREIERLKAIEGQEVNVAWKKFEDERVDNIDARVEPCLFKGVWMTRVRSRAELPLTLTLRITKRRLRIVRPREFRLDDPEFSASFVVSTTDEALARQVLSPPWRTLLREIGAHEFTYTDGNVDLTIPRGPLPDPPMLGKALGLVDAACGWQKMNAAYR